MAVAAKLSNVESKKFYQLYYDLLVFTNNTKKVYPQYTDESCFHDYDRLGKLARTLWENEELLDAYLEAHPQLSEELKGVVMSWKRHLSGTYYLTRYWPEGAMFVAEDNQVYLVKGLKRIHKSLFGTNLPLKVEATLIPWKNVIITDGVYNSVDPNVPMDKQRELHNIESLAYDRGRITTCL